MQINQTETLTNKTETQNNQTETQNNHIRTRSKNSRKEHLIQSDLYYPRFLRPKFGTPNLYEVQ